MQGQQGGLPIAPANLMQLLWVLRNADLTLTTDQAFTKAFNGTNYMVTQMAAVRKTGAFGVACLGGIYTGVAKAGNALVAAAQSWAALSGASKILQPTLAAIVATDLQTSTVLNLSLTTGNTGALTADVFVYGAILD